MSLAPPSIKLTEHGLRDKVQSFGKICYLEFLVKGSLAGYWLYCPDFDTHSGLEKTDYPIVRDK